MVRRTLVIVLSALVLAALPVCLAAPRSAVKPAAAVKPHTPRYAWIAGTALNGHTGKPVHGAWLHVINAHGSHKIVAARHTGPRGGFGLKVRPGTYRVAAGHRGVGQGAAVLQVVPGQHAKLVLHLRGTTVHHPHQRHSLGLRKS